MSPVQPSSPSQKLVSQLLLEDADLRDIVEEFIDGLPTRIEEFRQAFEPPDWEQLKMLAHRLKGASGSYGYPDLSELAAAMEQKFQTQQADEIATWMKLLTDYVAAAKAGLDEG